MDIKDSMQQIESMFSEMLLKMDEHSADITSLKKDIADLKLEASRNRTFQKEVALAFSKQSDAIAQQSDNIQYLLKETIDIKETQLPLESKIDTLDSFLREKLS